MSMQRFLLKIASLLRPKRRWCQYSVGTLLLIVTAVCVCLGIWVNRAHRQRIAVEALRRRNADVKYDYQCGRFKEGSWRARLRAILGDDYVAAVVLVDCSSRIQPVDWPRKIWFEAPSPESAGIWEAPAAIDLAAQTWFGGSSVESAASPRAPTTEESENAPLDYIGPHEGGQRYRIKPLVDTVALRCLADLRGLDELDFTGSAVRDADLSYVGRLHGLRELCLGSTQISDEGLMHLATLRNLRSLSLNFTRVTGTGFGSLGHLSKLEELMLCGTALTDEGLQDLGALQGLTDIRLDGTLIQGPGLGELCQLQNLEILCLSNTKVNDDGLTQLERLHTIHDLRIIACPMVTPSGVERLRRALPACTVSTDSE